MNIETTREKRTQKLDSTDIFAVMSKFLMRENLLEKKEDHVWGICISSENRILDIELIGTGSIQEGKFKPMEIFRFAIMKEAEKLVLVHNHQSLVIEPSPAEKDFVDHMNQVGMIVKVKFEDFLIINGKRRIV